MIVVGVGSGTSVDGIDLAALEMDLHGEELTVRVLGSGEVPFADDLRDDVLAVIAGGTLDAARVCRVDTRLGRAFADAVAGVGAELAGGRPDLVSSHGQTLFHDVVDGRVAGTLQLGQPAWIAERTGAPVVSDLRVADVAAGGQGAPLAGTWDRLWLAGVQDERPVAALNLGGIANVSVLGPASGQGGGGQEWRSLSAFDTGPANALIDAVVARVSGGAERYDTDGARAARGIPDRELLEVLLDDPYYRRPPPRTTGKEHFHLGYVDAALARVDHPVADDDLVATLTELTVRTVADALADAAPTELVASGGGARNGTLLRGLAGAMPGTTVSTSEQHGIPVDAKEACLFALLGFLTWHGLPGTSPSATGAVAGRPAGRITPGHTPLRMPDPATSAPTTMRVVG
ncbi:anhydro-N-acetylmuramic acid kinase [Ornithinimicrobium sp. LYQ92]|uniref:anhydro-N-acetylmuramic acid kinase n=1 Tax=Serinicoccus sp. LYQ92 TaxID=3378798 RepID=UPI0038539384